MSRAVSQTVRNTDIFGAIQLTQICSMVPNTLNIHYYPASVFGCVSKITQDKH